MPAGSFAAGDHRDNRAGSDHANHPTRLVGSFRGGPCPCVIVEQNRHANFRNTFVSDNDSDFAVYDRIYRGCCVDLWNVVGRRQATG